MHVLFFVSLLSTSYGFLLEKNTTGSNVITDIHYNHLLGLLTQEKENAKQMSQLILKLNNEMKSLQMASFNKGNGSSQEMTDLKNECSALKVELKEEINQVKNDNYALVKENKRLQSEIYESNNLTIKLKTELEMFTNSISADNLKNVTQIQSSVESLENKMDKSTVQINSLILSFNARNQDFLALLNQTKDAQQKITVLDMETKKSLQSYQNSTNQKFNEAFQSITAINQTVFLTSCADHGEVSAGSNVKFSKTKTVYGISDVNAFKNSGKFTCETAGVYLFSAFIMSASNPSQYEMNKNNDVISYVYIIRGSIEGTNYHTGTGIVAVSLNVGDTLYIKSYYDMFVYSLQSCMTVIKIR